MKQIPIKSPEQLFLQLGEEFTQLTMESNAKLIVAVDEEKYEDAAKHRDFINTIIENTVQMSQMLLSLDESTIRESFTRQNEIIYNALLEEYKNPTEPEEIEEEFNIGDTVGFKVAGVEGLVFGTIVSRKGDAFKIIYEALDIKTFFIKTLKELRNGL